MKWFLSSKIHKATVTKAKLKYVGSITIDKELLDLVGIEEGEKVLVTSFTFGSRLETYVISGRSGFGEICMNGPTAHLISVGEEIVIMGFRLSSKPVKSKKILVDKSNKFIKYL